MFLFISICSFILLISILFGLILCFQYIIKQDPNEDGAVILLVITIIMAADLFIMGRIYYSGLVTLIGKG